MALDVGVVNVIEVDGGASPTIQPAPTSIAGFLGRTERGVPNRATLLSDPAQLRARFGAARADAYLALAVEGFFLNGGQQAHVVRVVGAGSAPGLLNLDNRHAPAAPSLRLTAGYRGRTDPGPWSGRLSVDVRDDPRAVTTLAANAGTGTSSATLSRIDGFSVGSIIHIVDGADVAFRKLTMVDPVTRVVSWDPGAPLTATLHTGASATSFEFSLTLSYRASSGSEAAVVEQWRNLSMESDSDDYVLGRLNNEQTGSRYLIATDLGAGMALGEKNPALISNVPLASGIDNTPSAPDYVGDVALKTGLHALDTVQVQLVALPDAHWLGTNRPIAVQAGLDYCAARSDCMFIGASPDRSASPGVTPRQLSDYNGAAGTPLETESDYARRVAADAAPLQGRKVFGALYSPWIRVSDPLAVGPVPTRFIPPDGHVMGVYARTDRERGIWKAPAGVGAQILGALDTSASFSDGQNTDLVRNAFVNGIRPTPGYGIIVSASRTLSSDTRWWFVNVRLLFNFVKSSLRDGLRFVRQEPHTEELRRLVRLNVVTPFLLGLWRQGAFGSDPPAKVFTVKCDAENNPPSEVDLGNFRVEVYFYPVRPVETILLVVGQQPSGTTSGER